MQSRELAAGDECIQSANRVEMIEAETPDRDAYYTAYHYDTDYSTGSGPPSPHAVTRNNRLLSYDVYQGEDDTGYPLRTVSYVYYKTGDAANIIVKDHWVEGETPGEEEDYDQYRCLSLHYFSNHSLRLALWEQWKILDPNDPNYDYQIPYGREFRFDTPRQRYLYQDYPTSGPPDPNGFPDWDIGAMPEPRYTEYMGDTPYLDCILDGPGGGGAFSVIGGTRLFGGAGQQSLDPNNVVTARKYFHGDLIDSNVMSTDEEGTAIATTAYTAFGEAISWHAGSGSPGLPDEPEALGTRYQYAGAWGYEAPTDISGSASAAPYGTGPGLTLRGVNSDLAPITLSHVGARWYQPAIGRFVQRDPIGIGGGVNCYAYCNSKPMTRIDPEGEHPILIGIGIAAGIWTIYQVFEFLEALSTASKNPSLDPTANPGSGRDPRRDGRMSDCVRVLTEATDMLGLAGRSPPGGRVAPNAPVIEPKVHGPFQGYRPPWGWNWPYGPYQ